MCMSAPLWLVLGQAMLFHLVGMVHMQIKVIRCKMQVKVMKHKTVLFVR